MKFTEGYSKPGQISKMEVFAKIVKGFSINVFFADKSILNI